LKNLIWLASYPKSGNTWLRTFLTNLLIEKNAPADINQLIPRYWANDNILIEKYIDVEPSELTEDELLSLRPKAYVEYSNSNENFLYLKIHDAYFHVNENESIVPADQTYKVIYVIRNPIDIVGSFANHQGESYDEIIDFMNRDDALLNQQGSSYHRFSPERLYSWSRHVESWTKSGLSVLVVRYEDMQSNPRDTFFKISEFLQLNKPIEEVEKAIQFSEFKLLKRQEEISGFGAKNKKATNFFRKGKVGSGTHELSQTQIKKILADHESIMKQFKYI